MRQTVLLTATLIAAWWLAPVPTTNAQDQQQWGTIKGRIVWGGEKLPVPEEIVVPADKVALVANNPNFNADRNVLTSDRLLVNTKNRGVQNVFVYLLAPPGPVGPIYPALAPIPQQPVVMDISSSTYSPRCAIVRQGQPLVVTNGSPWGYNLRLMGDGENNKDGTYLLPAMNQWNPDYLKAQRLPLPVGSTTYGWMQGRVAVVNHPYAVLTDVDGRFELNNVPEGNLKLMIYHEEIGYRLGAKGKHGEPVTVPAKGTADLGELKIGR
jgi:hypothetical protein